MKEISQKVGYDIRNGSNDKITPVDNMDYKDNKKTRYI